MKKLTYAVLMSVLILPSWANALQDKEAEEAEEIELTPEEQQALLDAQFAAWDAMMAAKEPSEAARMGTDFLTQYPESQLVPYVHKHLAIAYQQLNDFENLVTHGDMALAGLPEDPHVRPIMALAFAENNENNKAIDYAEQALMVLGTAERPEELPVGEWEKQKFRAVSDSHYAQGLAFLKKSMGSGDTGVVTERAIEHFQKAAEADPTFDPAYFRLGYVYARMNDADKAIENYARAVAANGISSGLAKEQLTRIFEVLKKEPSEMEQATQQQLAFLEQKKAERAAHIQQVEEEERLRQQQLLEAQQQQLEDSLNQKTK